MVGDALVDMYTKCGGLTQMVDDIVFSFLTLAS